MAQEHLDDLWTAFYLGDQALGYYSRAYRFATYPRMLLAGPVNQVATGVYAELKEDRRRLSLAFFQINAVLVRSGFALAGWLALIAPEFIRLFLGERWLPMMTAFRLMLLFTLFDPLKITISGVLIAVGRPEKVSLARFIQVLVLLIGLYGLGLRLDIAGVALAVDLMLLSGILLLLLYIRPYVDYSPWRLFGPPTLALSAALGLVWLLAAPLAGLWDGWALLLKSLAFGGLYAVTLLLLEGRRLLEMVQQVRQLAGIR
jgi:O-antigen/teichoic acid export membrane protein